MNETIDLLMIKQYLTFDTSCIQWLLRAKKKAVLFGPSFFFSSLEWECCRKDQSHFSKNCFCCKTFAPQPFYTCRTQLSITRGKPRYMCLWCTLVTITGSGIPSPDPFVLWIILALSKNFSFIYIYKRAIPIINGLYYVICRAFLSS